jgi:hypothetical protein
VVEARRIRLIHPAHRCYSNPTVSNTRPKPQTHGPSQRAPASTQTTSQVPGQCCDPSLATNQSTKRDRGSPGRCRPDSPHGEQPRHARPLPDDLIAHHTPSSPALDITQARQAGQAAPRRRPQQRNKKNAAALGMRSTLSEEGPDHTAEDRLGTEYTTRQQRAARWYQEETVYASPSLAISNAQRALQAAGHKAEAWQTRQVISWRQLTTGNANSLRSQRQQHAKGTLRKLTQKQYLVAACRMPHAAAQQALALLWLAVDACGRPALWGCHGDLAAGGGRVLRWGLCGAVCLWGGGVPLCSAPGG